MEVIIWDNGSTDGTQKEVGRIFVEMEKEGWKVLNESILIIIYLYLVYLLTQFKLSII